MIDAARLLADLTRLRADLEDDLRERCADDPELDAFLQGEHRRAITRERTSETYTAWREEHLTQVAVAWILGCVFVRFLEDNALVDPPLLSGPGERRKRALDEHNLYFRAHPTDSDREYLLHVFRTVASLPVAGQLFDEAHNPIWSLEQPDREFRAPSGDAATRLLGLWQRIDPDSGTLAHDFADPAWDTRFLGDLYQDLSESARKRYALLQTPEFVEEFILDRTLDPAVEEFGFREVRLIDPACGSGHFLLGAFRRLDALWERHEPGTNPRERASRVLEQVAGVDLNPFAAAIARFRLCIAALWAAGVQRLADAPAFELHVAAGDSLLHGPRPGLAGARQEYLDPTQNPLAHVYQTEDAEALRAILGLRYHVVVGNPPYITPKDKALNRGYRLRFGSCHREYSLAVPFTERFFDLAHAPALGAKVPAGFVGMVTANSFMKREFGKKLIEKFIPRYDLTAVVDTSGAYFPGHGTPTVILFGRHRQPVSNVVRTVMGIHGEPSIPARAGRPEPDPFMRGLGGVHPRASGAARFLGLQRRAASGSSPRRRGEALQPTAATELCRPDGGRPVRLSSRGALGRRRLAAGYAHRRRLCCRSIVRREKRRTPCVDVGFLRPRFVRPPGPESCGCTGSGYRRRAKSACRPPGRHRPPGPQFAGPRR